MKFTDIFIRRPVLATVVSLMILVVGLRSFSSLQVLAYPKTENGVVTISTSFPGADPESMAGFITTPIETAVAQANGIDYMTSTSQNSTSTITVYLRQNYDTSKAAAEINIKVNSVLNQLPTGSLLPVITVKGRANHRRAVHGIRQRFPGIESNHRLPLARGAAEAAGRGGSADGRDHRRQDLLAARVARSEEIGSLWIDGERRVGGTGRQRLHFRGRQHQGADDPDHSHLHHEPAFPGGVSRSRSSSRSTAPTSA